MTWKKYEAIFDVHQRISVSFYAKDGDVLTDEAERKASYIDLSSSAHIMENLEPRVLISIEELPQERWGYE